MVRVKFIAAILLSLGAWRSIAQDQQHGSGEKLGAVHFATSCNEAAQKEFNRAVALLHSFQFDRAIEGFNAVVGEDATCGIAYWGIALSDWSNPFALGAKDGSQLQAGQTSAERGKTVGARTERERAYIAAVGRLYSDYENTSQRARLIAYRDAAGEVAAKYPDDHEAQILYALAIAAAEDPGWRTTLSIRTTCQSWRGGRLWPRSVIRRLRRMRRMRCTCHRIHLREPATGKNPSTATSLRLRLRGAKARPQKNCTAATTKLTRTCKPGRTRLRGES